MKLINPHVCVQIDAEAMEAIRLWTDFATGEFSCLGVVDDDLFIRSVHLFEQVCTDASTELDQAALAKFLATCPEPEKVRAHVHSHGNLRTFWSKTDEETFEGLANESFLVSIVVNKARELRCRVDLFKPFRLTLDEVPVDVRVRCPALVADCRREFQAKVREAPPVPASLGSRRSFDGMAFDWEDAEPPLFRPHFTTKS
jgi:hypothetical protein